MQKVYDLSEHNGNLNFQELKDNGVTGVILRLAWLGNRNNHTQDKKVFDYYNQAKAVGLNIIGFYVYSYCETLEALKSGLEFCDQLLEDIGTTNCTMFLDLEDSQIEYLSREELTSQAEFFCNYYILRGFKSGVYANKYWFTNKLNVNRLLDYKIWLAEWEVSAPTVSFRVDIWQYTSDEYIGEKRFDANICYYEDSNDNNNDGGDFQVKLYQNGSTPEIVYQDAKCTKQIGYLHPREQASCYGIVDNKALIVYNVDGTDNLKSGFVKWLGGVQ